MEFNKILYRDNPLHLYSYEINKGSFKVIVINNTKELVSSIVISYQDNDYLLDVNSSEGVIHLEQEIKFNTFVNEIPQIKSAIISGKEVEMKYDKNYLYIIQPKSIANMRDEKYLYIQKMVKYNGCKKENVKCTADQFRDYWHCTCGSVNLNSQDTCINCHHSKELLFTHEVDNSVEEVKTRRILGTNKYILWMEVILLFIQFFVIDVTMGGDLFFENENINSFIAIINRFVCPTLFTAFTLGLIFARRRYKYLLETIFDVSRIVVLMYLNIVLNISFVANSFAFLLFLGFNLIFIGLYISQIVLKIHKPYQIACIGVASILLVTGCLQANHFSKYDMRVTADGITLRIDKNVEELEVENYIDKVGVTKIVFKDDYDYSNVRKLSIGSELKHIIYSSITVVPNLEQIEVDFNNPYLYIEQDILFFKGSHRICMVPATLEEVTVNWEIVSESSFKDCKNLKRVVITKDVKEIQKDAFINCENLEEIIFEEGSSLTKVGELAFAYCKKLKEIEIPKSVQNIGRGILIGCESVEKVTIPFIGEHRYTLDVSTNQNVFGYTFGSGHNFAFLDTPSLKEVIITDQKLLQNTTFYKCPAEKITVMGDNLLEGAYFGQNSFYECMNLKEIVIPEGITEIRSNCFINCKNLEKVVLPSTLKLIDTNAFYGCDNLKEVIYNGKNIENIEIKSGNEAIFALFLFF